MRKGKIIRDTKEGETLVRLPELFGKCLVNEAFLGVGKNFQH